MTNVLFHDQHYVKSLSLGDHAWKHQRLMSQNMKKLYLIVIASKARLQKKLKTTEKDRFPLTLSLQYNKIYNAI